VYRRPARQVGAIPEVLETYLRDHRTLTGRSSGLVFGQFDAQPFCDGSVRNRAKRIWTAKGLKPIGFHEARHTFASLMIAANVNAKTLSTMMGHASITITLDRYGHLFPGAESAAGASLDAYLQAV
jgi:integrase